MSAEVETVQTGCFWEHDKMSGRVRALIVTVGFDHVLSKLWLEWVREPADAESGARVVAEMEMPELNESSRALRLISMDQASGRCLVTVDATQTHAESQPTERLTLHVGVPGDVRVSRRAVVRPD